MDPITAQPMANYGFQRDRTHDGDVRGTQTFVIENIIVYFFPFIEMLSFTLYHYK